MSTSITSPQTLKNVAATLVTVSSYTAEKNNRPMQKPISKVVNTLVDNAHSMTNEEAVAALYDVLLQANQESLKANYPEHDDMRHSEKHNIEPSESELRASVLPVYGKDDTDALAMLVASIDTVQHGLYGSDTQMIHDELEKARNAALEGMVLSTSLKHRMLEGRDMPTPSDVAESLTRLYAHGDSLYQQEAGASNTFETLKGINVYDMNNWGNDIFIKMYHQAMNSQPLIAPLEQTTLPGPTVRDLRQGNYAITSDIPMASLSDADTVNEAILFMKNRSQFAPVFAQDGRPATAGEKASVAAAFARLSSYHIGATQSLRIEPFRNKIDMTFDEARKLIEDENKPQYTYVAVMLGDLPELNGKENVATPDTPRRISELKSYINESKGRMMLLGKNNKDDIAVIRRVHPNATTLPVVLSKNDEKHLSRERINTVSASQFLLHNATLSAYDKLELPRHDMSFDKQTLVKQIVKECERVLPGVGEEMRESIGKAVDDNEIYYHPSMVITDIERNLPPEQRKALQQKGEPVPLTAPPERQPEDNELPLSKPALQRPG
jgi:hypothetical protein